MQQHQEWVESKYEERSAGGTPLYNSRQVLTKESKASPNKDISDVVFVEGANVVSDLCGDASKLKRHHDPCVGYGWECCSEVEQHEERKEGGKQDIRNPCPSIYV